MNWLRVWAGDVRPLLPICASYLGVVTVCVLLVYGGDWLTRPTSEPAPTVPDLTQSPYVRQLATDSYQLRTENLRLQCEVLDQAVEIGRLKVSLDAARRDAIQRPQAERFEVPADLIPPQMLPVTCEQ